MDNEDVDQKKEPEDEQKVVEKRSKKKGTKDKRRRRHRHDRKESYLNFNFDIPGVLRIVLGEKTQKDMGCIVGEEVTSEKPWKYIKKEMFEDNLEMNEESEFIPIRLDLITYPRESILLGYIPDETREYDEFYLVLAESAEDKIKDVIEKIREQQQGKIARAMCKKPHVWKSLGSEVEIMEYTDKTNRPLIEVEVEAAYPIMSPKVTFKPRLVAAVRDGYAELLCDRVQINIIARKRLNIGIQVAPTTITTDAQTICTYPKNVWTQYYYEFKPLDVLPSAFETNMKDYIETKLDSFCDFIRVNHHINLYSNDYKELVRDEAYTKAPSNVTWEEYMSFADLNEARNKMIASVCWHPIWTGTVAVAYSDYAPNIYRKHKSTADEVNKIVHGINPVLIWSFNDGLHPKLFLEAHRKVDVVSFCPFNENLCIGGLSNGQIILWDIRNKLNKVEEEEILTTAQQKYRVLIFSLMEWMKNTRDFSHVRPTAESDSRYSHTAPVTSIKWMSPYRKITKTGQVEEIREDEPYSLQFATSSGDGSVLFWDLLAKPVAHADYKPQRKSRRLKVRPSALTVDVSPFRMLNRLLRPVYRLNTYTNKKNKPLLLSCVELKPTCVTYQNPDPEFKSPFTQRLAHPPIMNRPADPPIAELVCSSHDGYFMTITWDGYDVDPGEAVNQESVKITNIGRYHDGPVTCIDRNTSCTDLFMTVGGKCFCIWNVNFKDRPVIWRKSRHRYLGGSWNSRNPSMLRLSRSDGNREVWYLTKRSDKLFYQQTLSGNMILGSFTHSLDMARLVLGVADYNGTFRMFYIPGSANSDTSEEAQMLANQVEREVSRKTSFIAWQEKWLKNNQRTVQEKQARRMEKQRKREERALREKARILEEKQRIEKEKALAAQRSVPQPGQYMEWAQDQWRIKEEERMNKILLMKKQLNPDLLVSQQMPLKSLQQEEERKKKKQKERLQKSDRIFNETVAMLFPDVIKKKPPPPLDPYAGGETNELKENCLRQFKVLEEAAADYIDQHKFVYNFNWKKVIQSGRERRRMIDSQYVTFGHRDRHENEKKLRMQKFKELDRYDEADDEMTEADFVEEDTVD